MPLLTVLHHPDVRLRTVAQKVTVFDEQLKQTAENMLQTMYYEEGIGLAATQVNIHKRLLVMDVSVTRNQPLVCVNPKVTILDGAVIEPYKEGCLSVPDYTEIVNRPNKVRIDFQNISGEQQTQDVEDLLAICVQHEYDHLDGKLFIDYLSLLKRNRITNKLKKKSKLTENA